MVNLLQSPTTRESQSSVSPTLGGGNLSQRDSSTTSQSGFHSLFQDSKSEQLSPPSVKKLAAAVQEVTDQAPSSSDEPSKKPLSELSGEELLQFLMTQSELDDSTDIPEHLAAWIEAEVPAELGPTIKSDETESVIADEDADTLRSESLDPINTDVIVESTDLNELDEGLASTEEVVVPKLDEEVASTEEGVVPQLDEEIERNALDNQPETDVDALALTDTQGVQPQSSEPLIMNGLKSTQSSEESTLDKTNGISTPLSIGEAPKKVSRELNIEAGIKPNAQPLDIVGTSDRSELKPISLLVSAPETESSETTKLQVSSDVALNVGSQTPEAKNVDMLASMAASLADSDVSNTPLQASLTSPEPAKVERALIDTISTLETAQKLVKLPDVAPALSDRIFTMIKNDIQHGFIRLDPPELGALEVRIQVSQESTQIQIVSQSQQVREALESQSVRLREALAEQGLNLSNFDVNEQSTGDSSAQSEGRQGNQSGVDESDLESQNIDSDRVIHASNSLVDQYV